MLEPGEEPFDDVAVAVLVAIELAWCGAIAARWDDCLGVSTAEVGEQRIGVVSFIGQDCGWFDLIN